jgi:hypothetical protein
MKRENQRQKRIKFDEKYYAELKDEATRNGINFYELTEDLLDKFSKKVYENGLDSIPILKPTLKESVKSIWVSENQMKFIVDPISREIGVSGNTLIYTAFMLYKKKNKNIY